MSSSLNGWVGLAGAESVRYMPAAWAQPLPLICTPSHTGRLVSRPHHPSSQETGPPHAQAQRDRTLERETSPSTVPGRKAASRHGGRCTAGAEAAPLIQNHRVLLDRRQSRVPIGPLPPQTYPQIPGLVDVRRMVDRERPGMGPGLIMARSGKKVLIGAPLLQQPDVGLATLDRQRPVWRLRGCTQRVVNPGHQGAAGRCIPPVGPGRAARATAAAVDQQEGT